MRRKSPFRWIRGISLELLGVGLIVWVAAGAPLPDVDVTNSAPPSHPFAAFGRVRHEPTPAREEEGGWLHQVFDTPPVGERQVYTQRRLEAAGERLVLLGREVAAALLAPLDKEPFRDLPAANDSRAPSCPSCTSW